MIFNNLDIYKNDMDYNEYKMSLREKIFIIIYSLMILVFIGYVFYNKRPIILLFFAFLSIFFPIIIKKIKINKQKSKIKKQFKDSLYSLSSSLEAGKSLENAIEDVIKDLLVQYDEKSRIVIEYKFILKKIKYNQNLSKAFLDFAKRSKDEDIYNFAMIYNVSKNIGGNLNKVIKRTSRVIAQKGEIKEDINLLIESKKNEIILLNIMPVLIIFFLSITSKNYINPLYNTIIGAVTTTIALILLLIAGFICIKIIDVEV